MMGNGITASIDELIALREQADFRFSSHPSLAKQAGAYQATIKGRGMEFSEVRHYQAGDDIRHMEWRVTARTGRPHVKLFQEEKERPIFLMTDFNPSMFFGTKTAFKSVIAARLCALLAWRAFRQGDKVGGTLFDTKTQHEFAPNAREAYLLKFLSHLAKYTHQSSHQFECPPRPLSEVLLKIRRVNKPGSLIILISDFYAFDQASDAHLKQLRQHHDLLAFHICDPIELTPPQQGLYAMTDHTHHLLLDTSDKTTRQIYLEAWQQKYQVLRQRFQKLGINYTLVQTNDLLPHLLQNAFPRRHHGR